MLQALLRYLALRTVVTVLIEHVLIVLCILNVEIFRQAFVPASIEHILKTVAIAVVFQIFLHLRDVYDLNQTLSTPQFLTRLTQALSLGVLSLVFLTRIFSGLMPDGEAIAMAAVLICVFITVWHLLIRLWVRVRIPPSNLLVIGTGGLARE